MKKLMIILLWASLPLVARAQITWTYVGLRSCDLVLTDEKGDPRLGDDSTGLFLTKLMVESPGRLPYSFGPEEENSWGVAARRLETGSG